MKCQLNHFLPPPTVPEHHTGLSMLQFLQIRHGVRLFGLGSHTLGHDNLLCSTNRFVWLLLEWTKCTELLSLCQFDLVFDNSSCTFKEP